MVAVPTLGAATIAIARPAGCTGPGNASGTAAQGAYSGPSTVPLMTVGDLLDKGLRKSELEVDRMTLLP